MQEVSPLIRLSTTNVVSISLLTVQVHTQLVFVPKSDRFWLMFPCMEHSLSTHDSHNQRPANLCHFATGRAYSSFRQTPEPEDPRPMEAGAKVVSDTPTTGHGDIARSHSPDICDADWFA